MADKFTEELLGTVRSLWQIGVDYFVAGVRTLRFQSGANAGDLTWTPTANRTATIPDKSGTLAMLDDVPPATDAYELAVDSIVKSTFHTGFLEPLGQEGMATSVLNAGAVTAPSPAIPQVAGLRRIATGTNAAGAAMLRVNGAVLSLGGGSWLFASRQLINIASASGQTFTAYIGFLNITAAGATAPTDGVFFIHELGRGWWCRCVNSGSVTETSMAPDFTFPANTYFSCYISINAAGTSATFIAGNATRIISTNLPTSAKLLTAGYAINKTGGTSDRWIEADSMTVYSEF